MDAAANADDDADLLRRWRSGRDRAALDELVTRHAETAYRVARALSASGADAEDAVQSAFMRVMDHARQWSGRGSVRSWIIGIVANCARQQQREATARRRRELAAEVGPSGAAPDEDAERRESLRRALAGLGDPYRTVLAQHYLAGVPVAELAATQRTTINTIHSQLRRGLERLRERCLRSGLALEAPAVALALGAWRCEALPARLSDRLRQLARTRPAPTAPHAWALIVAAAALALAALVGTIAVARSGPARPAAAPPPAAVAANPPPPQPVADPAAWEWSVELLPKDTRLVMRTDLASLLKQGQGLAEARRQQVVDNLRAVLQQQMALGDPEWHALVELGPVTRRLWLAAGVDHGLAVIEGERLPRELLDVAEAFARRLGGKVQREHDVVTVDAPDITDSAGHGMRFVIRRIDDGHLVIGDSEWIDAALARRAARGAAKDDNEAKRQFLATAATAAIRVGFDSSLTQQAGLPIRSGRIEIAGDDQSFHLASVLRCSDAATSTRQAENARAIAKQLVDQSLASTTSRSGVTEAQLAAAKEGLLRLQQRLSITTERDLLSLSLSGTRDDFADLEALALGAAQ